MNKLSGIILIFIVFISCKNVEKEKTKNSVKTEFQEIKNADYELSKPTENIKRVLVLFGSYLEKAEDIKREFNVIDDAKKNSVALVFMNYHQKLWLTESEKKELTIKLHKIFKENKLPTKNTFFGGFSSGGNVALLISDFLSQKKSEINPKGVFVVDSPVDLVALYKSSEKNIERNFSEPSIQESSWLIQTLGEQFGNPNEDISKYQKYSIYTSETENIDNITGLKNTKIRFYTEPDTVWWKENRMADLDQMNAYYLKQLSETLKKSDFNQVEYIPTKNRGYRANGDRHPHSWGIVEKKELMNWIAD